KAVHRADGNVAALVSTQGRDRRAGGYCRLAGDHYPMFGAVLVALQAQAPAGADFDPLDLEPRALLEHGVGTPGSVHRRVQYMLGGRTTRELLDHFANILAAAAARHEH